MGWSIFCFGFFVFGLVGFSVLEVGMQGIDVSHFDGDVDWVAVGRTRKFAYVKATQGGSFVDPLFERNWAGLAAAGLQRGAYHYLTPDEQAADQAAHFLSVMGGEVGNLPPAVDVEETFGADGAELWALVPLAERVAKVVKFCSAVEASTGVVPILYASPSFVDDMLGNDSQLGRYGLWVAEYGVAAPRAPRPFTRYRCWQYSESGTVSGVAGASSVDLNVWVG